MDCTYNINGVWYTKEQVEIMYNKSINAKDGVEVVSTKKDELTDNEMLYIEELKEANPELQEYSNADIQSAIFDITIEDVSMTDENLINKEFENYLKDTSGEKVRKYKKISPLIRDTKKTEFTYKDKESNSEVIHSGYKVTIPEFPNLSIFISNESAVSKNSTDKANKSNNWNLYILAKDNTYIKYQKSNSKSIKDELTFIENDINEVRASNEKDIAVLKEIGIDLELIENNDLANELDKPKSYASRIVENIESKNTTSNLEVTERILSNMKDAFPEVEVLNETDENVELTDEEAETALREKQIVLLQKYASHYLSKNKNSPIIKEAIKKFGSEETIIKEISDSAIRQEGIHYSWLTDFKGWITDKFNNATKLNKNELLRILTDAFLTNQDFGKISKVKDKSINENLPTLKIESTSEESISPSQVFMPWKFKSDMSKFIKNGKLDISLIDPKILQVFMMRIPNQGPNSQVAAEIVGFFPKNMGDLAILSKDLVAQLGHDFDFDSIYTYLYSTVEYEGKLRLIDDSLVEEIEGNLFLEENERARLLEEIKQSDNVTKNKIVDTHIAIHSNTSSVVQSSIKTPIGRWVLADVAGEIEAMKEASKAKEIAEITKRNEAIEIENNAISESNNANNTDNELVELIPLPISISEMSDDKQTDRFLSGTSGRRGVSLYSLFNSFLSVLAQDSNVAVKDQITYKVLSKDGLVDWFCSIGNRTSRGRLDESYALDKKTLKTQIAEGFQSISVDNANDMLMDKINLNVHTFKFTVGAISAGFGEEMVWLMNQPIIIDYVESIKKASQIGGSSFNSEMDAYVEMFNKYNDNESEKELTAIDIAKLKRKLLSNSRDLTIELMKDIIAGNEIDKSFNNTQLTALVVFKEIENVGAELQAIMSDSSTDSSFLGKSVLETSAKEMNLIDNLRTSSIINIEKIFGSFDGQKITPTTINGHATVRGLFLNNELWGSIVPYNKPEVQRFYDVAKQMFSFNEKSTALNTAFKLKMWNNLKSFLFTDPRLLAIDDTVDNERQRLFFDSTLAGSENTSLSSYIKNLKKTQKSHTFINVLNSNIELNTGRPSTLTVTNAKLDSMDLNNIYAGFIDMIINNRRLPKFNGKEYSTRLLAQDLVLVALLSGNNGGFDSYMKLIPPIYLYGIKEDNNSVSFLNKISEYISSDNFDGLFDNVPISSVVSQIALNNPDMLPVVSANRLSKAKGSSNRFVLSSDGGKSSSENPHFISVKIDSKKYNVFVLTEELNYVKMLPRNSGSYKKYDFTKVFNLGKSGHVTKVGQSVEIVVPTGPEVITATKPVASTPIETMVTSTTAQTTATPVTNQSSAASELLIADSDSLGIMKTLAVMIETSSSTFNRALSKLFQKRLNSQKVILKTGSIRNNKNQPVKGGYRSVSGVSVVSVNTNSADHGGVLDRSDLETTLLHELSHAVTKDCYANALAMIKNGTASNNIIMAVASLDGLFDKFKKSVADDKSKGVELDEGIENATLNMNEFFAEMFANQNVQKYANRLEYKTDQTFFERFTELIGKLMVSLGLDVNSTTALALSDIIYLVDNVAEDFSEYENNEMYEDERPFMQYFNTVNEAYSKLGLIKDNQMITFASDSEAKLKRDSINNSQGVFLATVNNENNTTVVKLEIDPRMSSVEYAYNNLPIAIKSNLEKNIC